ncbi:phosphotriesterase [Streptomyces olivochromogenes]|uniref:Phosphotriesterase n=1 Tax=Streptomyces olivochromogenes TaxID=1963 RepID=A0A250VWJ1_STROL|nr:phosphotriesterase [Streptomyces olivochromogenes]
MKCAIEDELTPGVERVMRSAAQAHLRTGAPITVHTSAHAPTRLTAQEILRSEGVDLGAVVIGHSGDMVVSHDASCHIDWFPPGVREQIAPNWHYTHLYDHVRPALLQAGVTQAQLDTMLIDNPPPC